MKQENDIERLSKKISDAAAPGKEAATKKEPGDFRSWPLERIPSLGAYEMKIARDGSWYYQGSKIERHALVKLFASVLRRDQQGVYWLATPLERGVIEVEDAPFIAETFDEEGQGKARALQFRTNVEDEVTLGRDFPLRVAYEPGSEEPNPYILVRDGLEARLSRSAFYHLCALAVEEVYDGCPRIGVWSGGVFFPLDKETQ